ncbi:hypothetical protein MKX03_033052, partial [Papaver bracteatum]
ERMQRLEQNVARVEALIKRRDLQTRYDTDKKELKDARDELLEAQTKTRDRLDATQNWSLGIFVFLITFNGLFYAHLPRAGNKMNWFEFLMRLVSIMLCTITSWSFLRITEHKIDTLEEEGEALDEEFELLKDTFFGLSTTSEERKAELGKLVQNSEEGKGRELVYKLATDYDGLRREEKISAIELRRFNNIPLKSIASTKYSKFESIPLKNLASRDSSRTYLNTMYAFTIFSAVFMVGVSIWALCRAAPK